MADYYRKWTKADIQKCLDTAKKQAAALKESCLAAQADLDLSAQGREKRVTELIERMGARINAQLSRAADMARDMRKRLQHEADLDAKRASEAAHQLRVQNCVKALEARGAEMTKEEFLELLEPVAFDITSQHVIKAAAGAGRMNAWKAGVWAVELYAPALNRKQAIGQLDALSELIKTCWDGKTTFAAVTGLEAALTFNMLEIALNHWNDELTLYS